MALLITITDAGRAEMINADNTGTGPVVITEIGFGTGQYAPSKTQTALTNEVKRVSSIAGQAVAADTIHVVAKDEGADAYNVGEFGLYSASGTLVAVYSQDAAAGWIIQKAGASTLLLAVDIILESLDAASLTFGDVTFINPPATTSTPGVVQLEDSLTSSSTSKALTAKQGKALQDGKQPLDATLTALAALATAADKLIYATGPDTFATTTLSAFIRTLLDDANATAALATLGAAPLASPALTGAPTAPTAVAGTSTTQLATTAFVAAVKTLLDAAIDLKAPLASPALTGTPTAPTAVAGTSTTQLATTAFVAAVKTLLDAAINLKAPLASPVLTGTPTAPTAAQATNTTQLATTAFVKAAIAALVDSSPGALDTLNELAAALGDDPNFATTMTNALADKQPLDATLTALAALATAADKLIYATASDQFATTTLTAKARTLLASEDELAMRALLQLVKQTSVTDLTAGALMINGAHGLGAGAVSESGNCNNIVRTGFFVTGSATLNNPGAGGVYIISVANTTGIAVTHWAMDVVTGAVYTRKLLNGTWSVWREQWHSGNLTPAELSPPGAIVHFARNSAPSGWLKANGAAVSRSTYAALYAAIGTTFGAGDGSTTFNLPDQRGEFARGWDDGRGVDAGRAFGSAQADAFQIHGFAGTVAYSMSLQSIVGNAAGLQFYNLGGGNIPTGQSWDATVTNLDSYNTSKLFMIADGSPPRTAAETRPRNTALLACIKY